MGNRRRRRSGSTDDSSSSSSTQDDKGRQEDAAEPLDERRGRKGTEGDDDDDDEAEESDGVPSAVDGDGFNDEANAPSAASDPSKRRILKHDESDSDQSTDNDDDKVDLDDDDDSDVEDPVEQDELDQDDREEKSRDESKDKDKTKKKPKVHKLSLAKTEDFNEKLRKRGVVYVARIPPRMTPTKVRALLGEHGEVTRVYLVEEDAAVRRRRRKLHGGNGSKRYTEGWVEFASKKVARHVAASLNASAITHYKRSPHYGDLWSLKYLKGFKWSHLTEKVAYERRVREQKLRLETMQARRDTVAYKQLVETGKKLDKIEERKRRREERQGRGGGTAASGANDGGGVDPETKRAKYKPKQVSQIDADATQRGPSKKPLLGSLL
jgi:ESF2/ABP1 family protein